jgi:hypothetical protein
LYAGGDGGPRTQIFWQLIAGIEIPHAPGFAGLIRFVGWLGARLVRPPKTVSSNQTTA